MEFMIMGRGGGKTTEMMKWMRETGASCAVHSAVEAHRLEREYPDLKGRFVMFDHLLNGNLRGWKGTLGIDNVDILLQYIAHGIEIGLVTGTGEKLVESQ